jgi:hypothetical protein
MVLEQWRRMGIDGFDRARTVLDNENGPVRAL